MDQLTIRENQIGYETCLGLSEKMVAEKLFISEKTVHTHKKNIRKKIGAANDKDLVRMYVLSNIQKFMLAVFMALQCHMTFIASDFDVKRVRGKRVNKTARKYEN